VDNQLSGREMGKNGGKILFLDSIQTFGREERCGRAVMEKFGNTGRGGKEHMKGRGSRAQKGVLISALFSVQVGGRKRSVGQVSD